MTRNNALHASLRKRGHAKSVVEGLPNGVVSHMALRVARGLFRLWLVLSVLWIGGVGVMTWREYPDDWLRICAEGEPPGPGRCLPPLPPGYVIASKPFWADPAIHRGIVLAVVPPAFVLALGSALIWAFKGFR